MFFFFNKHQDPSDLIQSLQRNYTPGRSIAAQIKDQFVSAPWDWDTVYEKKSWMGKIALWLRYPSEKRLSEQKAVDAFIEIFKDYYKNPEELKKIPFGIDLISEFAPFLEPPKQDDSLSAQDFDYFDDLAVKKEEKRLGKIEKKSLLDRFPITPTNNISKEQIHSVLFERKNLTEGNLDALKLYLEQNPDFAAENWEEKLQNIRQGHQERLILQEQLKEFKSPKSKEAVHPSKLLAEKIHALKPGETFQFNLSYGTDTPSFSSIIDFFKNLPTTFKEKLPPFVKKFLDSSDIKDQIDPQKWIESAVHEFTKQLAPLALSIVEATKEIPNSLLPDQTRELPDWTFPFLPEMISAYLDNLIKDGLIKDVGILADQDVILKLLDWANGEGREIYQKKGVEGFLKTFETKCLDLIKIPLDLAKTTVNDQIGEVFNAFSQYIPPIILEMFGKGHLLQSGPLWYTIKKNEEDTFDLEIHTLGHALKYHQIPNTTLVTWPLRFEGIKAEDLNEDLIERILFHYFHPQEDNSFVLKIGNLYQGTFEKLWDKRGHAEGSGTKQISTAEGIPANDFEMAQAILFNTASYNPVNLFEMRFSFFVDFCAPYFKDRELTTDDPKKIEDLSAAVSKIEADARQSLGAQSLRLKAIIATCQEINYKIDKFKKLHSKPKTNEITLPPDILKNVHQVLTQYGLTKENAEILHSSLGWAFGEEMESFLEASLNSVGNLLPSEKSPQPTPSSTSGEEVKASEENPGPSSFTGLYLGLIMTTMKYVFIVAQLSRISLKYLLMVSFGRILYPYISHLKVVQYFERFQSAVKRSITQTAGRLILDFLITKNGRDRLEELSKEWRDSLVDLKDKIERKDKLSYKMNEIGATPVKQTVPKTTESPQGLAFFAGYIPTDYKHSIAKRVASRLSATSQSKTEKPADQPTDTKAKTPTRNILTPDPLPSPAKMSTFLTKITKNVYITHPTLANFAQLTTHLTYFLHQISRLEIPTEDGEIWNNVPDPDVCLQLVVEIGARLNDLFLCPNAVTIQESHHVQIITATYHLLAIADFLARRSPEWTIEAKTNAYPLLKWLKGKGKVIKNHETWLYFQKVAYYFFPEYALENPTAGFSLFSRKNLLNLPEKKWLYHAEGSTLFNPYLYENITNVEFASYNVLDSSPELIYLEQFTKDPVNQEKLKKFGWKQKTPSGAPSSRTSTMTFLIKESYNFSDTDPLLPACYRYLRLQTLMASTIAARRVPSGSVIDSILKRDTSFPGGFKDRTWGDFFGIPSREERTTSFFIPSAVKRSYDPFPSEYYFHPAWLDSFLHNVYTQTQIMEAIPSIPHLSSKQFRDSLGPTIDDFAYIGVEPKDRILRMMEWMREHMDLTVSSEVFNSYFEIILFQPNELQTQLKHSPDLARGINCFLKELLDYHEKNQNNTTYFYFINIGLQVRKIIESVVPEQATNCLNFYEILRQFKENKTFTAQGESFYNAILAMSVYPSDRILAATTLCEALLQNPILHAEEKTPTFEKIAADFALFSNKRISDLEECLNHRATRSKILNRLLQTRGLKRQKKWRRDSFLIYSSGGTKIDFVTGKILVHGTEILPPQVAGTDLILISSKIERASKITGANFVRTDKGIFSEDGQYELKLTGDFELIRTIEGVTYRYEHNYLNVVQGETEDLLMAFNLDLNTPTNQLVAWIDETEEVARLVIHLDVQQSKLFPAIRNKHTGKWTYYKGPSQDQPVVKLKLDQLNHKLDSLNRFCQASDIQCFYNQMTGIAESLYLTPFKLLFEVRSDESGNTKAYCANREYSGYEIATTQYHPSLESILSYLILENNGQKLILVPPNLWLLSPLWKMCNFLGPLGRLFAERLPTNFSEGVDKVNCYSYTLNEKGELTSTDPYALAYLLSLQILQFDTKASMSTLKRLETMLHSRPIDTDKLIDVCFPILFLPPASIYYIRLRLLAAIKRNNLTQLVAGSNKDKTNVFDWGTLFGAVCFIDYNFYCTENHPYNRLTTAQEYFLFQYFFNSLNQLAKHFTDSFADAYIGLEWLQKHGTISFCELFLFSPQVSKKWEVVKEKYGISESFITKGCKWYKKLTSEEPVSRGDVSSSSQKGQNGTLRLPTKKGKKGKSSALSSAITFCNSVKGGVSNQDALYETLHSTVLKELCSPPLEASGFNSSSLQFYFISYYAIARGEFGDASDQKKLRDLLNLEQGGWDKDSAHLIKLLQIASSKLLTQKYSAEELIKSSEIIYNDKHRDLLKIKEKAEESLKGINEKIQSVKEQIQNKKEHLKYLLTSPIVQPESKEFDPFASKEVDSPIIPKVDRRIFKEEDPFTFKEKDSSISKKSSPFTTKETDKPKTTGKGDQIEKLQDQIKFLEMDLHSLEKLRFNSENNLFKIYDEINTVKAEKAGTKSLKTKCKAWFDFFDSLSSAMEWQNVAQLALDPLLDNPLVVADGAARYLGVPTATEQVHVVSNYLFAEEKPNLINGDTVRIGLTYFQKATSLLSQEPKFDAQPYANMANRFIAALKTSSESVEIVFPYFAPDYSTLEDDENWFNQLFKKQFDLIFEEETKPLNEQRVLPFDYKGKDPAVRQHFEKVNQSLETFYNNRPKTRTEIRVRNLESLTEVYASLHHVKARLEQQLKEEKKGIIKSFAEINRHQKYAEEITLPIVWDYIEKYEGELAGKKGPKVQEIQFIESALARYEHRNSRFNQLVGILNEIEKLKALSTKPVSEFDPKQLMFFEEKFEVLADRLMAKTVFSFKDTPLNLLRSYVRFQSNSGKMIWVNQAKRIGLVTSEETQNNMNEQGCGEGKSSTGMPNDIKANGNSFNLTFVISPKPVSGTLFHVISSLIEDIWSIASHRQHHERDLPYTEQALEALFVTLDSVKESPEPIFMTRVDLESLFAILIDQMHHYVHYSDKKDKNGEKRIVLLQKCLALIFNHGFAIIDEAHAVYDQKQKLNLPLGAPKTIKEKYFNAIKGTFALLIKQPHVKAALEENKLYLIDKDNFKNDIVPNVAREIARAYGVDDAQKIDEFVAFFCNKGSAIPQWLLEHRRYKEICLAKGTLTIHLNNNRKEKNRSNVEFGVSKKENNGEYVRPYDGNSSPVEESTIQNPHETLIKTFLNILVEGLSIPQVQKLCKSLKEKADIEMKKRPGISYSETRIAKLVNDETLLNLILASQTGDVDWTTIQAKVKQNSELLFAYIRLFIWKKIEYWDWSIQIDSQKFAHMIPKQHSGTGTPYNQGTYAPHIKKLNNEETIGQMIHDIFSKCPDNELEVLQNPKDGEILKPNQVLEKVFDKYLSDPLCSMLIDGGALFTGLSSEHVAREMLRYAQTHRKDIAAVKFFKKDEQDVDQIYLLTDPDGEPVFAEYSKYPPEQCLTFIDHPHGVAANIPQKKPGYAVETFGPKHPLYRQIQESFRELRDPKKDRSLQPLMKDYNQNRSQMIRFVTTEEVATMIAKTVSKDPSQPLTVRDAFEYGITNEAKMISSDNWASMIPKINNVPHQLVYSKMMKANFKELVRLYEEFEESLILTRLVTDTTVYGLLPKQVAPEEALTDYFKKLAVKLKKSSLDYRELRWIETEINKLIHVDKESQSDPLPELITVYHNGSSEIEIGIASQLNQQQQVSQHQHQENKAEEKEEQENQLFEVNKIQVQNSSAHYRELRWQKNIQLNSLDWLVFADSTPQTILGKGPCPLFSLRETFLKLENPLFKVIAPDIDEALWFPNNWLPIWPTDSTSPPAKPGSLYQKTLFEVLVHFKEGKQGAQILKVTPLSQQDANMWRKKMDKALDKDPDYWKKQEIKTMLWDPHNRTIGAGCQPDDIRLFKKNKRLKQCIVTLKFLSGDVRYRFYRKTLERWFKQSANPRKLVDAFREIHAKRGRFDLSGTDIDRVISEYVPEEF